MPTRRASTARCSTIPMRPIEVLRASLLTGLLVVPLSATAAPPVITAPGCPDASGGRLAGLHVKGVGDADCVDPVVIEGARDTAAGLKGQRAWIAACRPGARIAQKALRRHDGKTYEVVELRRRGHDPQRVCFDISSFFGVW